jgi:ATPase subunit of ABC transporter with duplicated ATPase domains
MVVNLTPGQGLDAHDRWALVGLQGKGGKYVDALGCKWRDEHAIRERQRLEREKCEAEQRMREAEDRAHKAKEDAEEAERLRKLAEEALKPRLWVHMPPDELLAQAKSKLVSKGLVLDPARVNIAVTGINGAGKSSLIKALLINLGGKCKWARMGTFRAGMGVASCVNKHAIRTAWAGIDWCLASVKAFSLHIWLASLDGRAYS